MATSPADLIVVGGTINAVDDAYAAARAFAVAKGRFAYVGSIEGAMALRGPATRIQIGRAHV